MKLWIDDIRNPEHFLGEEGAEGVVWKNEAWSARKFLFMEVNQEVEILYLDNFLGDRSITGEKIISKLSYRIKDFPKLKIVYLHSSDDNVVSRILENYKDRFNKAGVELVDAPYREHD